MKWLMVIFFSFSVISYADQKDEPNNAYEKVVKKIAELPIDLKEYSDSCLDHELKSSWRNGYFPDGGIRARYCHIKGKVEVKFIEDLFGEKIFTNFDFYGDQGLYSKNSFGHYNTIFLEKINIEIDKIALKGKIPLMQEFYEKYFRDILRIYYVTYKGLGINSDFKKNELKDYLIKIKNNESIDIYKFVECENIDAYWPEAFKIEWAVRYYVKSSAAFFWLRRDMDKTGEQIFAILKKSLFVFDNEFLESVEKMSIDEKYKVDTCYKTVYGD